jgi:hypothetical protein
MKNIFKTVMLGTACMILFQSSAMAAWTFSSADLVLGFQATGGQGSTTNLFYNLGDSFDFSQDHTTATIGNINDDLVAIFGANWNTRTDVYFGVFGNRSNLSPTLEPGDIANGIEPGRTVYLSSATLTAGAAALRASFGSSTLGTGTNNYGGLRNILPAMTETAFADGVASINAATNPTEWNNSWSSKNPAGGASFLVFGGIQQNFSASGGTRLVDVQRMTANSPSTYEGTIAIGADGSISSIPEVSSSLLAGAAGLVLCLRRRRVA